MPAEGHHDHPQPRRRLQFSLRALLGLTTVCGVVFGLVAWLGLDLAFGPLMVGGFAIVLLGDWLRRDAIAVWGGILLVGACVVILSLAATRLALP